MFSKKKNLYFAYVDLEKAFDFFLNWDSPI